MEAAKQPCVQITFTSGTIIVKTDVQAASYNRRKVCSKINVQGEPTRSPMLGRHLWFTLLLSLHLIFFLAHPSV